MAKLAKSPEEQQQQALQKGLWQQLQLFSRNLIYMTMMRGGGEPFGAPFESGPPTLTERIVKMFQQKSFFGFETLEKLRIRSQRNKYTRHGAAPFKGPYTHLPAVHQGRGFVARFITYLRENRFFLFAAVQPTDERELRRRARRRPTMDPQQPPGPLDLN